MKKHLKTAIGIAILLATIGVFAWYIASHPEVITQLRSIPFTTFIIVLVLYVVWWLALAGILQFSVRLYRKELPKEENILLSAYSSLLNFFGPGQSGPGLRAIYLKKRHGMKVKDYIFATLIYYAFYAIISAFMLLAGSTAWWLTFIAVGGAVGASAVVLRWYARKSKLQDGPRLYPAILGWLFALTLLQLVVQFIIYTVEIHAINSSISLGQALSYTGAANFALFVALTPGAIGIREAFLVFTQGLHHIDSDIIVGANVIDRSIYLVFLGLLFVLVISLHAGKKLRWKQITAEKAGDEQDSVTQVKTAK